jgi:glycosyltransferase involved in cell wall biosynthesis
MILDLYFCLWNEARLLPFLLGHYGPTCRRIVALDDGSDDGTLEILAAHPKVEIRHIPEERDSWVIASTRWWNQVWQESRDADWVAWSSPMKSSARTSRHPWRVTRPPATPS